LPCSGRQPCPGAAAYLHLAAAACLHLGAASCLHLGHAILLTFAISLLRMGSSAGVLPCSGRQPCPSAAARLHLGAAAHHHLRALPCSGAARRRQGCADLGPAAAHPGRRGEPTPE